MLVHIFKVFGNQKRSVHMQNKSIYYYTIEEVATVSIMLKLAYQAP